MRTTQPSMTSLAATRPMASISRRPSSIRSASELVQRSSPSKQKYSSPRLLLRGVGDEVGRPVLEVLDPADPDVGLVDVDPVVGKRLGPVDDQNDREEVAILERLGGRVEPRPGGGGLMAPDQVADRQGREEVLAVVAVGPPARNRERRTRVTADPSCSIRTTRRSRCTAPPARGSGRARLPTSGPDPAAGYWKLVDQRLDHLALGDLSRPPKRAIPDRPTRLKPLIRCAAQSAEMLAGRHPPELLGVGLEEDLEEQPAEAVDDPVLEAPLGPDRPQSRLQIARDHGDRTQRTELRAARRPA